MTLKGRYTPVPLATARLQIPNCKRSSPHTVLLTAPPPLSSDPPDNASPSHFLRGISPRLNSPAPGGPINTILGALPAPVPCEVMPTACLAVSIAPLTLVEAVDSSEVIFSLSWNVSGGTITCWRYTEHERRAVAFP